MNEKVQSPVLGWFGFVSIAILLLVTIPQLIVDISYMMGIVLGASLSPGENGHLMLFVLVGGFSLAFVGRNYSTLSDMLSYKINHHSSCVITIDRSQPISLTKNAKRAIVWPACGFVIYMLCVIANYVQYPKATGLEIFILTCNKGIVPYLMTLALMNILLEEAKSDKNGQRGEDNEYWPKGISKRIAIVIMYSSISWIILIFVLSLATDVPGKPDLLFVRHFPLGVAKDIAVDSQGAIYIYGSMPSRIQVYTQEGEFVRGWFSGAVVGSDMVMEDSKYIHVCQWKGSPNHHFIYDLEGNLINQYYHSYKDEGELCRSESDVASDSSGNIYSLRSGYVCPTVIKQSPLGDQSEIRLDLWYLWPIRPLPLFIIFVCSMFYLGVSDHIEKKRKKYRPKT